MSPTTKTIPANPPITAEDENCRAMTLGFGGTVPGVTVAKSTNESYIEKMEYPAIAAEPHKTTMPDQNSFDESARLVSGVSPTEYGFSLFI